MENNKALMQLFSLWTEQAHPPIIELLNIDQKPVGALYLDKFRDKGPLVISDTNNQERYYLFCDGIGLFFSFYKKLYLGTEED